MVNSMTSETSRIEAFSDGVFAIAITLLILEVKIPPAAGPGTLWTALLQQWPFYAAFLLSFSFIGVMWMNHHRLFTHIQRTDDGLILLNLILLMGVTVVPFPTAILALHFNSDGRTAAALYNATYIVIAIAFNLLWRYALRHELLDYKVESYATISITTQYSVGPIMYILSFLLAFYSPVASMVMNGLLGIYFAIPPQMLQKTTKEN